MSLKLDNFRKEISTIFSLGINILNLARSLKGISSELQVLAYNGVVLSAKINSNQGKSLITLSRFLSDLPSQIGPELEELEKRASELADELTLSSLKIKKIIQYSLSLNNITELISRQQNKSNIFVDINYFDKNTVNNFINSELLKNSEQFIQDAVNHLINKNNSIIEEIYNHFFEVNDAFNRTRNTSEKIKRNAFIADYMGSNILIESAYLDTNQKNFKGFVDDIERIIKKLNSKIEDIDNRIGAGIQHLSKINNI